MPAIKDVEGTIMKEIRLDESPETWQAYKAEVCFIDKCIICGEPMAPEDSFGELGYILGKSYKFLKVCRACFESVYLFLLTRREKAQERDGFLQRIHKTYP